MLSPLSHEGPQNSPASMACRRSSRAMDADPMTSGGPYKDFARMEKLVASSQLDWTIVRPPLLTNGPATGRVRSQTGRKDLPHGPYRITRADLAATLLDLAAHSRNIRDVLLVSERKPMKASPD